jgi:hypothetical protein
VKFAVHFDEVVLVAADEPSTTFGPSRGLRLSRLDEICKEITVYFSRKDQIICVSHWVNPEYRLGYDGPPNKGDRRYFREVVFEFVDCTGCNDYGEDIRIIDMAEYTHQYDRRSPTVRNDIARALCGLPAKRPAYDDLSNVYDLFSAAGPAIA